MKSTTTSLLRVCVVRRDEHVDLAGLQHRNPGLAGHLDELEIDAETRGDLLRHVDIEADVLSGVIDGAVGRAVEAHARDYRAAFLHFLEGGSGGVSSHCRQRKQQSCDNRMQGR